ncbi:hypothetical protein LH464_18345 [Neorhizobium sp. T786]|uniref:hypothetical protein n=1 Tax=Pseudorhizobium xiangyangii TaxID=2883104 RepID=UPI001CFFBCD6|nr:hypothetical protein [Neorhizobium xiangyangii]MCB5204433.1 hypothetical protein [Neorhizobium xiangyangii]
MTKQIIPFTFTDSDGDTFTMTNIHRETHDSGVECVTFTVTMNGDPVETLEWLGADGSTTDTDSHLGCNHSFGWEATQAIHQALDSWLDASRGVAA